MKAKLLNKSRFVALILFLFSVSFSQAQTFYALKIDRNIRKEAKDITAEYQQRLVMRAEQVLEFQNTVAKYMVKRKSVEKNAQLSGSRKHYLLKIISSHESSEMADVLYPYQWQEYLHLKPKIQPVTY